MEPDYEELFEDAMRQMRILLDRIYIEDINPIDVPYIDAYYNGKNLEKWHRDQQARKLLKRV